MMKAETLMGRSGPLWTNPSHTDRVPNTNKASWKHSSLDESVTYMSNLLCRARGIKVVKQRKDCDGQQHQF